MGNLEDAVCRVERIRNLLYDQNGMDDKWAEELNQAHYSLQLFKEELEVACRETRDAFSEYSAMCDSSLMKLEREVGMCIEKIMNTISNEI